MINLCILGSTGSIGTQALEVVTNYPDRFRVHSLSAWSNVELLADQVRRFAPKRVAVARESIPKLKALPGSGKVEILGGREGLRELASDPLAMVVLNALVGNSGLIPTFEAVKTGKKLLLANKESLVIAGEKIIPAARSRGTKIIPIDSEHAALFQALEGREKRTINRVFITASGGPFWARPDLDPESITPAMVLEHPVWSMGPKVTVDSATMMNKGLERIEARWLFGLEPDQVRALVHPRPLVHAMVQLNDGNVLAHLSVPDMRIPICWALFYPDRAPKPSAPELDLSQSGPLEFHSIPPGRFPCYELAGKAMKAGGAAGLVLSAADEAAVNGFLAGEIGFSDIPRIVAKMLDDMGANPLPDDMESIIAMSLEAEARARELCRKKKD